MGFLWLDLLFFKVCGHQLLGVGGIAGQEEKTKKESKFFSRVGIGVFGMLLISLFPLSFLMSPSFGFACFLL